MTASRIVAVVLVSAGLGGCGSEDRAGSPSSSFEPVAVSNAGVSKAYYKVGEYRLAGRPNDAGLDGFQKEGVKTVINLLPDAEMKGYDEKTEVESRKMSYVSIPVTSQTLGPEIVAKFLEAVKKAETPAVIHCASANRVSGLWAIYLVKEKGVDPDTAVALARKSGLREGPTKEFVTQYLETRRKSVPGEAPGTEGDAKDAGEPEKEPD